MTTEIDLPKIDFGPLNPTTADNWGEWECRYARAILMSYMVYPTAEKEKSRTAARTVLGYALANDLRNLQLSEEITDTHRDIIKHEDEWFDDHKYTVGRSSRIASYHRKFRFVPPSTSKKRYPPSLVRDLLTLGFIVHTMYRAHLSGHKAASNIAIEYVYKRYRGRPTIIVSDEKALKKVMKWRAVAHLAAAYYRLIMGDDGSTTIREIRSASLTEWKEKMPRFLTIAHIYQEFLTDPKKQSWSPNLHELPPQIIGSKEQPTPPPLLNKTETASWLRAY